MFWGCGEPSGQESDVSDQDPCHFGCGGSLKVFGKAPASAAPGKSPFDNPATRQKLEAFDAGRPLDDLNRPRPTMSECLFKLVTAVNAIGKDMPQSGEPAAHPFKQRN